VETRATKEQKRKGKIPFKRKHPVMPGNVSDAELLLLL
jgi:hypothetical protein